MAKKDKKPVASKVKAGKKNKETRSPVVAVLGHVDHGKSSLLEAIREDFAITEKESGGITQHIGAYEVESNGKKISFIDTPGHEAFSAMRQRGANVADVAILVIDAVEGIKDQTKEAIKFIKQAGVPMIVVFNKMDKPGALPEKVKPRLIELDITVESYGGDVPSVDVSAKEKQGIKELLETILVVAEMEELDLDIDSPGEGTIIESELDAQKGPVTSLILEKGTLEWGDILGTNTTIGKAKNMSDFQGKEVKKAIPSQPIRLLGFETTPPVGERFKVYDSKEEAQKAVGSEVVAPYEPEVIKAEEGVRILNIILKTDVLGTCEAIQSILMSIPQEKAILRVLKAEAGHITASDVQLANNSNAAIFGFKVEISEQIRNLAEQKKIRIQTFDVIYELVQGVRETMTKILSPEVKRIDIGKFEITHIFKQTKDKQVIGGKVKDGEITLNTRAEIEREEEIIGKGRVKTLQKEKQDIGKATKGQQVAMSFNSEEKVQEGDILLIFREEKEKGTL
ncbi:MAG: translation initiation factor IF-2 [Parcubacteria group bacterium]|nr:translation initiation factor IF-2 [Parcubacteria group bacterium]